MKKQPFKIDDIIFDTPFILAPLAGITDRSMRSLCLEQGASFVYTEMVSGKGLWYGDRKSRDLLVPGPDEKGRFGIQVFGSDPEIMEFTANSLRDAGNLILDLNAGCPVPKIVKNGEGSALIKQPDLLYDIVCAMVKAAGKPVTVKFRMGFAKGEDTAVETAKAAEAAGASAVTVHGRTREQYYEGRADWDVIARVKDSVGIPVIGNGDVNTGRDAVAMLQETGCDGVMIARGALGNPWIFRDAAALWNGLPQPPEPTVEERVLMLLRHLDMVAADKGEGIAVREIRKHVGWYIKGIRGASYIKREVNSITDIELMRTAIRNILDR